MGRVCVLSCRCCVFMSVVHPVAILSAVFCVICGLLSAASGDHMVETQFAQMFVAFQPRADCVFLEYPTHHYHIQKQNINTTLIQKWCSTRRRSITHTLQHIHI